VCTHVLRAHEVVLRKTTFYVGYIKMIKFGSKISLFATQFLSFLHSSQKISVFYKTVRQHIECGDIRADIFFLNFVHFKICFPIKRSIGTQDQKVRFQFSS
jgi:hypothetical protein